MKLLVVEDLDDSFFLINNALSKMHQLVRAKTVAEATSLIDDDYDLALIDVSLPDGDGFQLCDWIRTQKQKLKMPIIFLTANNTVESRITGFTVGGDDYISKPFNFIELKTRIEAKLRKKDNASHFAVMSHGISLDMRAQRALINEGGNSIDLNLTPIEFKILNLLILEPEKVFTRDEILNNIWGKNVFIYPRCIDTHVSKLRSKLQQKSACIKSVHGIGYKFSKADDEVHNQKHLNS